MRINTKRLAGCLLAGALLINDSAVGIYGAEASGTGIAVMPVAGVSEVGTQEANTGLFPIAGVSLVISEYLGQSNEQNTRMLAETEEQVSENEAPVVASEYTDIAIAQVNNYVNVRQEPNTESEVVGKLYNNSAATILETTEDGWYQITSGNVTGYVKCEYVVAGDEELAKSVSTKYATVTTETLYVRKEPNTSSGIRTMLPEGDDVVVIDDSMAYTGWVLVSTVDGDGYISTEYVEFWTEYVTAESKEEEEARLAKEEAERQAAAAAAAAARKKAEEEAAAAAAAQAAVTETAPEETAPVVETAPPADNSNGQAVVDYASQFVGNPYVYGGTSLTNGADCSGFVMSVYAAFGVSLPHSSRALRSVGYGVSTSEMQPGDIICYSGHAAIYVGDNTIVHASSPSDGIKFTSPADYHKILAVRRIF